MNPIDMGSLGSHDQNSRKGVASFSHREGLFNGGTQMHLLPATRPKPCVQYGSSHVPSSTMIETLRRLYHFVLKIHWEGMAICCPDFSFPQLKAFFVRALYDLEDLLLSDIRKTVLDPLHELPQIDEATVIEA